MVKKRECARYCRNIGGGNGAGYKNGPGNIAKFNKPGAAVVDEQLNIYICDTGNNCIRKVTSTESFLIMQVFVPILVVLMMDLLMKQHLIYHKNLNVV